MTLYNIRRQKTFNKLRVHIYIWWQRPFEKWRSSNTRRSWYHHHNLQTQANLPLDDSYTTRSQHSLECFTEPFLGLVYHRYYILDGTFGANDKLPPTMSIELRRLHFGAAPDIILLVSETTNLIMKNSGYCRLHGLGYTDLHQGQN